MPKYDPDNEAKVAEALLCVYTGDYKSMRQACLRTGAKPSTVSARKAGRPSALDRHPKSCRLTVEEENRLVRLILALQEESKVVNHQKIRAAAEDIARERDASVALGVNWVSRFVSRRPELQTTRERLRKKKGVENTSPCPENTMDSDGEII